MAVIGYYSMQAGEGDPAMVDDIIGAGHTAVNIATLSEAELSQIDVLYVWNPDNLTYGTEFVNAMPQISSAIAGGMNMVMYDRAIGQDLTDFGSPGVILNPQVVLPGTNNLIVLRHVSTDADLTDLGEGVLSSGPGGAMTDTTLDGVNYTTHGYVDTASLPPGAEVLVTTAGNSGGQAVGFSYPYGEGTVQYYGMPMDAFNESNVGWESFAINSLYASAPLCLGADMRVTTPAGLLRVADLRPGDLVWTLDHGYQPLRHAVHQMAQGPLLEVPAGLTGGMRALVVSPQHRLLLASPRLELWTGEAEALAPALAFGDLARPAPPGPLVNLLFDRQEIIAVEGVLVESLLLGQEAARHLPSPARLGLATARGRATRACRMILPSGLAGGLIAIDLAAGSSPFPGWLCAGQTRRQAC